MFKDSHSINCQRKIVENIMMREFNCSKKWRLDWRKKPCSLQNDFNLFWKIIDRVFLIPWMKCFKRLLWAFRQDLFEWTKTFCASALNAFGGLLKVNFNPQTYFQSSSLPNNIILQWSSDAIFFWYKTSTPFVTTLQTNLTINMFHKTCVFVGLPLGTRWKSGLGS